MKLPKRPQKVPMPKKWSLGGKKYSPKLKEILKKSTSCD